MNGHPFLRFFAVALFLLVESALGQEDTWTFGTAMPLRQRRWEVGVFEPLRYGLGSGVELTTFPLVNFLMPNLSLKKTWARKGETYSATEHGLSYPTPLLRTLARSGTGGIFPEYSRIPHIVSSTHTILLTRSLDRHSSITACAGVAFALRSGPADMPTIDYPIVFPRMSPYYHNASVRLGLDFSNALYDNWILHSDLDLYLLLNSQTPFAYEHKSLLVWYHRENLRILGGYKLVYGTYPFGTQIDAFPLIDMEWGIR